MENSLLSCEWGENNNKTNGSSSSSSCYPSEYYYSSSAAIAGFQSWLPPPPPFEEDEDEEMMMRSCGGGGGSKTASKSHSQAEKRRRDRINAQLATLRKLIPMSHKMDKAALLSSAVDHVKELKIKVAETRELLADIPADTDEVVVVHGGEHQQTGSSPPPIAGPNVLRASVCCDDRPELFAEINSALRELRLQTVHAEVSCLGGRVKGVFLLLCPEGEEGICVNSAKQSLKVALSKVVMPCSTNSYRIKSKRQRFFLPPTHYYYHQ